MKTAHVRVLSWELPSMTVLCDGRYPSGVVEMVHYVPLRDEHGVSPALNIGADHGKSAVPADFLS